MKFSRALSVVVLGAGTALAQNSSLADELKALREAVTAQQQQIAQQQQQMTQQQQQMAQQQQMIEKLQQTLAANTAGTAHVEDAALHTNAPASPATVASDAVQQEKANESPLSFRI